MTTVQEKFDLKKVDGDCYVAWNFKQKLLLIHKDVWEAIEGASDHVVNINKSIEVEFIYVQDTKIVHIQVCVIGKEACEIKFLYKIAEV